jgi:hypothetical protein
MLYYVVCWTETEGIYSCGHDHLTIPEALGCLVPDGGMFIRVRDQGVLRSLNDLETELFEYALKKEYGGE